MPSVSFDRAANYYDQTRGFADGVAEQVRDAIVAYLPATPATRFLELGVGTGRVALPFIQAGYDYTGVDLSQPMMDQLERKLADDPHKATYHYRMMQGDVTRLPLPDAAFDVAIAVHVLHLVDGWQEALREARRVLRRPGTLIIATDGGRRDADTSDSANGIVNKQWDTILRGLGVDREKLTPGINNWEGERTDKLTAALHDLGATTEIVTFAEYPQPPLSPRQMAERHMQKMYSSDWSLPDAIHAEAVRRLETWLATDCADPDTPITTAGRFDAIVGRWV